MAVNREQILQSAEKLLSRGKLDQALKEYLRVLEENAKDIPTLNKVGDLYVRMNRPGESIPYFERIADFYSKDGFFLKAIAIYKKINKIDPARLEVYDRLADLYHKQGLVQDARSQYQVLADHYQKNNRLADAITVYKKMAQIDPADLRIQVRLADLYRAANQKEQAVMQYGLIGSMLLKRGAHDEAAQVFQKALELSPDDVETQRNLVRSLLAQKNASAAMAVLKAAPRTGESLGLMAEAQLEMGERAEAVRTAEQALALDADAETPRMFLCRVRVQEMNLDKALAAIAPLVLTAVTRREFTKGAEYLEPILAADPGHVGALEKLASVLEAEGNRPALAKIHLALGETAERQQNPGAALEHYRRAQEADPSNVEAATRVQSIGAPTEARAETAPAAEEAPEYQELIIDLEDSASVHAPQPRVASIEYEERAEPAPAAAPEPGPSAPPPAAAPAGEQAPGGEEQQVETLIVEAEVFARYGLADKAIERLFSLVRRRPDLLKARERLVELLAETKNPGLSREAEALAAAYNEAGRPADASRILARVGSDGAEPELAQPASAAPPPAPGLEVEFDEFDVGHPAAPPAEIGRGVSAFPDDGIEFVGGETGPPPSMEKLSTPAAADPGGHRVRVVRAARQPARGRDAQGRRERSDGGAARKSPSSPRRTSSPTNRSSSTSPRSSRRTWATRSRRRSPPRSTRPRARCRSRRSSGSSRRASSSSSRPRTTRRTTTSASRTRRWDWSTRRSASSSSRARTLAAPSSAAACSATAFSKRECPSWRSSGSRRASSRRASWSSPRRGCSTTSRRSTRTRGTRIRPTGRSRRSTGSTRTTATWCGA